MPLLCAASAIVAWQAWQLGQETRHHLGDLAGNVATELSTYIDNHRHAIEALGRIHEQSGFAERSPRVSRQWLDLFHNLYPGLKSLAVSDPAGEVVAVSPDPPQDDGATLDRAQLVAAAGQPETQVTTISRTDTRDLLVLMSRAFHWNGQPETGVVQAVLDLPELVRPHSQSLVLPAVQLAVVDGDGHRLVEQRGDNLPAPVLVGLLEKVLGAENFVASSPVHGTAWQVIARQSPIAALAPLGRFALGVALIVVAVLLVAALVHARLSGALGHWLRDAAGAVEAPHIEDIQVPSPPARAPQEIGTLAEALRRMVSAIAVQHDQMQEHLAHLEVMVESRTAELKSRQHELEQFLNTAPALIVSVDEQGAILYTNQFWDDAIGTVSGDVAHINDFLTGESAHQWWDAAEAVVASGRSRPLRLTIKCDDGARMEVSGNLVWQAVGDGEVSIRGVFQDITELAATQRELHQHQELLAIFVRNAPVAIAMLDQQGRFIAVSDRWLQDYRLEEGFVIGRDYREVLADAPAHWQEAQAACLQGAPAEGAEDAFHWPDGTVDWIKWEMIPWRSLDGEIGGLVMMTELVTDQKILRDQLRILADYDSLTGLLNRRAMLSRYRRMAARSGSDKRLGFLFIDLDRFKAINDRYGHHCGDLVLQEIGERLKLATRAEDLVGRLSGDEFVVLVTDAKEDTLSFIVKRYEQVIGRPIELDAQSFEVTASIGSVLAEPGEPVDDVLDRADKAMYASKRGRRKNRAQGTS